MTPKKPINPFAAITDSPLSKTATPTPSPLKRFVKDILALGVIVLAYTVHPHLALLVVLLWVIDEIRQTRR